LENIADNRGALIETDLVWDFLFSPSRSLIHLKYSLRGWIIKNSSVISILGILVATVEIPLPAD